MAYKLLVINPGSTSTKVSYFENEKNVFTESIFHDAPELLKYPTTNDQMPMRKQVLLTFLQSHGMTPADMDVFIGRGGCAYSQQAGVMTIDEKLVEDTAADCGGSDHPAKLGVMLAYDLCRTYGGKMYTVNPTNVDELCDYARPTGIAGLYRRAQTHVLNQKGIAAIHAKKLGKGYEDLNLIVCHVDGGITVTAHSHGRMIDSTEGAKDIGMNHWQTMLHVIMPQALRNIIPQIGNNFIINIKDTSVLSVISITDLFFVHKSVVGALYTYFESAAIVMVIYLTMTLFASYLLRLWEKALDGPQNYDLNTTDSLAYTSGMYNAPDPNHESQNLDMKGGAAHV